MFVSKRLRLLAFEWRMLQGLHFGSLPSGTIFDPEVKCHKVGSRGPCPLGQLVVFEKYSGKSYRGECGCSPGYNQNYWPQTGQCFEWYTQGPCKDSFLFQYNRESGRTECVCDEQEGFVFWNETQKQDSALNGIPRDLAK